VILVLGGTSDARLLADELRSTGYDVLLSAASAYGARLAGESGTPVRGGALDEAELMKLIAAADAVVDATHPFAEVITESAREACTRAGRPYLRVARPDVGLPAAAVRAAGAPEAAEAATTHAAATGGAILLTVGAKTVRVYAEAARAAGVRVVARVLPTEAGLRACAKAGLEPHDVVALQGPASAELDAALLRHLGATVLVSKDSGDIGGLREKLRAAELAGATAVVVERPAEPGAVSTTAEVLDWLAEPSGAALPASDSADCVGGDREAVATADDDRGATAGDKPTAIPAPRLSRGLLQVYTGDGKGKTTAAAGLALRALGAGLSVTFVQFVKGGPESSELAPLRAAGARVVRPATVPSGLLRGAATREDGAAVAAAWAAARAALADPAVDLVVLDELHAALRSELASLPEVLDALAARPPHQEVVTTGRGAPDALLAAADLITEMGAVRHPYPTIIARRGIDL
jgi:precorrin-6A/cobalt-precorrin-6A reductase